MLARNLPSSLTRPAGAARLRRRQGQLLRCPAGALHPAVHCPRALFRLFAVPLILLSIGLPQYYSRRRASARFHTLLLAVFTPCHLPPSALHRTAPQSFSVEINHEETLLSGQVAYLQASSSWGPSWLGGL